MNPDTDATNTGPLAPVRRRGLMVLLPLVVLAAGALVGLGLGHENGYALFHAAGYTLETALTSLLALLLVLAFVVSLAWQFLRWLLTRTARRAAAQALRARRAARANLHQGLLLVLASRWHEATGTLTEQAGQPAEPLADRRLRSLARIRALAGESRFDEARHLGQELLDSLLTEADGADTRAATQWLLARHLPGTSADTLARIVTSDPAHAPAARLTLDRLADEGRWGDLLERLETPVFHALYELNPGSWQTTRETTACRWLDSLHRDHPGRPDAVQAVRARLPADLRDAPAVQRATLAALIEAGAQSQARQLLEQALNQRADEALMALGLKVTFPDPLFALSLAQQWLRQHPETPALLDFAARASALNRQWGAALEHAERAFTSRPTPTRAARLAELFDTTRRPDEATAVRRRGLELATQEEEDSGASLAPLPVIGHGYGAA